MRGPRHAAALLAVALLIAAGAPSGVRAAKLGRPAPELRGGGAWVNAGGSRPVTMAGLRGRVVLVEIWTGG